MVHGKLSTTRAMVRPSARVALLGLALFLTGHFAVRAFAFAAEARSALTLMKKATSNGDIAKYPSCT
jgi:hypothetical protein